MLIPWSAFWERNYFVQWSSALSTLLTSNYTRGAVSGLGLVNVWAALAELADMFASPRPPSESAPPSDLQQINRQSEISNQQ